MRPAKSATRGTAHVMRRAADTLCLDFANTVAWRKSEAREERLPSASSLLAWSVGAGVLDAGTAAQLGRRWETHPGEAAALYEQAVALREAIYRMLLAGIRGVPPPADALQVLNTLLSAAPPRTRIAPSGNTVGWWIGSGRSRSTDLLAPIAWSAADMLTGPRMSRVRECADDKGCGWLFLDESRAGTRRWCSMGECGNRAKARRHYLRRRLHADTADPAAGS